MSELLDQSVPLKLRPEHIQAMRSHAERTYPDECCGLLLGSLESGDRVLEQVRPVENTWDQEVAAAVGSSSSFSRARRYWIAPEEMLMAMREARNCSLEIIGIYHSHPDHPAVPSECDRQLAWPQYSYIIVSVAQGYAAESKSWILDDTHQFQPEPIVIAAIADPHASSPPGHTTYTQPNVINERNHAQP